MGVLHLYDLRPNARQTHQPVERVILADDEVARQIGRDVVWVEREKREKAYRINQAHEDADSKRTKGICDAILFLLT